MGAIVTCMCKRVKRFSSSLNGGPFTTGARERMGATKTDSPRFLYTFPLSGERRS